MALSKMRLIGAGVIDRDAYSRRDFAERGWRDKKNRSAIPKCSLSLEGECRWEAISTSDGIAGSLEVGADLGNGRD